MLKHILLTDDSEDLQRVSLDLKEQEYEVSLAHDGEEAIEFLTQYDGVVDAVVLELEMPHTNGWEALRVIKDEDCWPEMPVLIHTTNCCTNSALKAWILGAHFVLKSHRSTSLLNTLDQVI